jgi:ABC-type iron transport system FetAB ATPase subunit
MVEVSGGFVDGVVMLGRAVVTPEGCAWVTPTHLHSPCCLPTPSCPSLSLTPNHALHIFSVAAAQGTQARVALGRLQELLSAAELPETDQAAAAAAGAAGGAAAVAAANGLGHAHVVAPGDGQGVTGDEPVVTLQGDFTWDLGSAPSLTDIHVQIRKGQLVAVVGPTGCGKTSLLSAMLGLMPGVEDSDELTVLTSQTSGHSVNRHHRGAKEGLQEPLLLAAAGGGGSFDHTTTLTKSKRPQQAVVRGSTAYVPQAAFLIGMSVRDNILFGMEWDAEWYQRCTAAAQLEADFAQFPAGDLTELGEWRGWWCGGVSGWGRKVFVCVCGGRGLLEVLEGVVGLDRRNGQERAGDLTELGGCGAGSAGGEAGEGLGCGVGEICGWMDGRWWGVSGGCWADFDGASSSSCAIAAASGVRLWLPPPPSVMRWQWFVAHGW